MPSGRSRRPSESQIVGPNQATTRATADGPSRGADVGNDMTEEFKGTESQSLPSIERDGSPRTQKPQSINPIGSTSREGSQISEPPVTKSTLSELDVNKIVNNPKLRHDINFDPELHFRPNVDGEKGKKKSQKAETFWTTMRTQLQMYLMDREQFEREIGHAEWALPGTLRAIREILETLVPQRDRSSVEETFNVNLLMQQFRNGAADMTKLSTWLSRLLKSHCAPMRDDWVDEMVNQFSNGDRNGDVTLIAHGMKSLLGILEAMKLDVANHQIRCLRPLLIEDTVHFEQKFFMKKINLGRVDVNEAHAWYKRASSLPDIVPHGDFNSSQGNTWDFMKALVHLSLPTSAAESIPHTFLFDEERLLKIRADLQDLINLEVCMYTYHHLDASCKSSQPRHTLEGGQGLNFASPMFRPASPVDEMDISLPTVPSQHDFVSNRSLQPTTVTLASQKRWSASLEDDCSSSSSTSSPYCSPASLASTPDTDPSTPFYLSNTSPDISLQVHTSLIAILNSSTSSDKWRHMAPALALQVLRSTSSPLTHLPRFEAFFCDQISNPESRIYRDAESRILQELSPALRKLVDKYTPLTSLQIFEAATGPKAAPLFGTPPPSPNVASEVFEIATRLAHLGILHWRVWAPLAYLVEQQEDDVSLPVERAKSMP